MTELLPVAPHALAIAFAVTVIASAIQGTIGFGFAIASVPILSLVDPHLAPVPQLLVVLPLSLVVLYRERKDVDLKGIGWVLVGRIPGAAIGLLLLKLASPVILDFLIAGMVMVAVVIIASGASIRRNKGTELGAGVLSGAFAMVSSIGGPPIALLYREAKGATIRSSLAVIFCVGLTITITTRAVAREMAVSDLIIGAILIPGMFLGFYISRHLTGIAEGKPLRVGILVVAGLSAIALVIRAVSSLG
ncbi:MAG: sulfite exporter TauE/SafE family protein [Myxococcota bacterium]